MVRNEKEIGSQKNEMMAQTTTQSTKESTSDVKNSFNTIHLMSDRQPPMHLVIITAHAAISKELPFPFIAQQDDVPDADAPLPLQLSMCVYNPLVEMMVRTLTQSTFIMESSSEIEIPKPSYHFIHVTAIDAASTSGPKIYEYAHDDSHIG